ncbi:MAG: hypothetical protein ACLTX3_06590 [Lachnospiraceae bacterium]
MNKKEISIVKRMLGKGKGSITQLNCSLYSPGWICYRRNKRKFCYADGRRTGEIPDYFQKMFDRKRREKSDFY